jgi:putative transposase
MIKTFEVQLLPTEDQLVQLKQHAGAVRWLWNQMLEANIQKYEQEKKFIFRFEMQRLLPELRKQHLWLTEINSQSLHEQCINLNNALVRIFKNKAGFPRFKSKHDAADSFAVPQFFNICNRSIKLPKIGRLKYAKQRCFEGKAKRIVVKQRDDKWFALISCELPDVPVRSVAESEVVGIDVGIKDFAILSDGTKISNPKHLEKSEKLLRTRQKALSRKVKGSQNCAKARNSVAKLHRHITNQRKDFQWKLVASIAKKWQVVALEDLNIQGMMKNRRLSKAIGSAGWSSFKNKLNHKLAEKGGYVVEIGRFAPSSKTCSSCGLINDNLTLNDREWDCECGVHHDRDVNAAVNIRNIGIKEIYRLGTGRIYACGVAEVDVTLKQESRLPLGDPTCS